MSVEELHQAPPAESGGAPPADQGGGATDQGDALPSLRDTIGEAAAGEDRVYIRDGRRFVAKSKEEAQAAQAGAKAAEAGAQKKDAAAQTPWRPLYWKDEFGDWNQLSEAARKAIETREREAGKYQSETGQRLKAWEPLAEAVKPFEAQLKANGQTPQQFMGGLVQIYGALQQDPVQTLNWLAQSTLGAGWDIRALADWMDEQNVQGQKIDPVQQELAQLKQQVQQLSQMPRQQQMQSLQTQIAAWSQDKPYFEEAKSLMASLAPANPGATLDQLYDMACHAHPDIRPRMLEAQRKAIADKARDANALNVRGTPSPGAHNATAGLSLRDQIKSAMAGRI